MATDDWDDLSDFTVDTFTHDGSTKTVYRAGEGPGVLFMHEVPGITPTNAAFARRLVDAGFTVAMPDLLGDVGRPLEQLYAGTSMASCASPGSSAPSHCGPIGPSSVGSEPSAATCTRGPEGRGSGRWACA